MSRLTRGNEKHNNEFISYVADSSLYPEMMGYEQTQAEMDAINKLGRLEDLEEELGIDLITLFKALKDGIIVVDDNYECRGLSKYRGQEIDLNIFLKRLEIKFVGCWVLSDYGKTWALSKNELEEQ